MTAYYNEFDPFAAAWLRNLIAENLIAPGDIDDRSILDVPADDLRGYTQCHFFAGIGGWSYALRLAGWPDDRPVWTGSCPCQPLSSAGKQKGHDDERHLWPAFYELIAKRRPPTVFGEQVASKLGREWLAGVRADLEDARYAVGAADLCAAGVGAPHIRQRLYWVGHSNSQGRGGKDVLRRRRPCVRGSGATIGVGNPFKQGLEGYAGDGENGDEPGRVNPDTAGSTAPSSGMGNAPSARPQSGQEHGLSDGSGSSASVWRGSVLRCADGKERVIPPQSEIFPLAHGVSNRVGTLRGAGNAIVPQVAAAFVRAASK